MDAFNCIKTKLDIREFSQEEVAEHAVGSMEFKGRLRTLQESIRIISEKTMMFQMN